MLIGDAHRCRSRSQVDLHGAGWDAHGPEQAIGIGEDTGVEVVDLGCEIREVKLTFKDIQSDEAEGIVVDFAIYPNICALHEAHVYIEEQAARPGTLNLGRADEAVEVGDR